MRVLHYSRQQRTRYNHSMRTFSSWLLVSLFAAFAVAACSEAPQPVPNTPEEDFVQTGMDSMMADRAVANVIPSTRSTNSWSDNPTGTSTAPLYPSYLRTPSSDCFYCWDSTGKVTRQDESSAACALPAAGSLAVALCLTDSREIANDPYFSMSPFWSFYGPLAILMAAVFGLPIGVFWRAKRRSKR